MNNFARAIRLGFQYRGRLLLSGACALAVGILWGANIGAVYPVVELLFRNHTLHEWIDQKVTTAQQALEQNQAELAQVPADPDGVDRDVAARRRQLEAAVHATSASNRSSHVGRPRACFSRCSWSLRS
jgi:hypothetical protein